MSMMLLGASCGCVRWVGMPTLPSDMVNHTELYGIGRSEKLLGDFERASGKRCRKRSQCAADTAARKSPTISLEA